MNYRTTVLASVLATSVAIGVAQNLHGASQIQGRSACREGADQPGADETAMREAAARGLLAYSGIKFDALQSDEALNPDLIAYGAF